MTPHNRFRALGPHRRQVGHVRRRRRDLTPSLVIATSNHQPQGLGDLVMRVAQSMRSHRVECDRVAGPKVKDIETDLNLDPARQDIPVLTTTMMHHVVGRASPFKIRSAISSDIRTLTTCLGPSDSSDIETSWDCR